MKHLFLFVTLLLIVGLAHCETLREAADRLHLFMGAAASVSHLSDSSYYSILEQQYNLITAENECKWAATEPSRGQFSFTQCDQLFNYAKQYNQTFRGHNLCWGSYNPNWLVNGGFSASEKRSILQNHITTVVKHYGDTVYCWDVVNEAVADSGTDLYKNNVWYPDLPDYVDFAFQTARAANSEVKLFYNDYNIASSTGWTQAKSDKVYNMVKSMKQRGIPIDGVGLQLHVDLTYNLSSGVVENLNRLAALGLEVHMTEIDVTCSGQCTSIQEEQQRQVYVALLKACLVQPKCTNFETWGFTDRYTYFPTLHPLPYDENYNIKPAYTGLLQTLQNNATMIVSN